MTTQAANRIIGCPYTCGILPNPDINMSYMKRLTVI